MFTFAESPQQKDFDVLASYLQNAHPNQLHPSLWQQRQAIALRLHQMSQEPEQEAHQAAYHALRLLVWD